MRFILVLAALCVATPAFAQDVKPSLLDRIKSFTQSIGKKDDKAVHDVHEHMQHGAVEPDASVEAVADEAQEPVEAEADAGNASEAAEAAETVEAVEETDAASDAGAASQADAPDAAPSDARDAEALAEQAKEAEKRRAAEEKERAAIAKSFGVKDARAYATSKTQTTGAVFLTIENKSDTEYRLMGATTEAAESIELHSMTEVDGKMVMRPEVEFVIPAKGTLELDPKGKHIMLIGLKNQLERGKSFPINLIISGGNTIETTVKIVAAGS